MTATQKGCEVEKINYYKQKTKEFLNPYIFRSLKSLFERTISNFVADISCNFLDNLIFSNFISNFSTIDSTKYWGILIIT